MRGLPSFPAADKRKDPRYKWFVANYGDRCWELDAMDPNDLRDCVEREIKELIEPVAWQRCEVVNKAEQESLKTGALNDGGAMMTAEQIADRNPKTERTPGNRDTARGLSPFGGTATENRRRKKHAQRCNQTANGPVRKNMPPKPLPSVGRG